MKLGQLATVRSKNAGPFWMTIDVFCHASRNYETVREGLTTADMAVLLRRPEAELLRFELPDIHVVKFSLPRPQVQGATDDRDMHGAQLAVLVAGLELPLPPGAVSRS